MRLGPIEIEVTSTHKKDGETHRYDIYRHTPNGRVPVHHGFRATEREANSAGWEDATLIRQFT